MRALRHSCLPAFTLIALATPAIADAAPIGFDCDTPTDRFSSVSFPIGSAVRITGTVSAASFRPGKNSAVGGMSVTAANGNAVGVQMLLPSPSAKALNVMLVSRDAGKRASQSLGTLPLNAALAFDLTLSRDGKGAIVFNGRRIDLAFANLRTGTAQAYCSSGQFKFVNLDVATRP